MPYPFVRGNHYSRRDVYRVIGIDEDTHGGNWDTGYTRLGPDCFIFCNVGTAGRTGHDYANQWHGEELRWFGKTNSRLHHPSIQRLLKPEGDTYLFWRDDNEASFTFAGKAIAVEQEDTEPAGIRWRFE